MPQAAAVMLVTHTTPNDRSEAILAHLAARYKMLARNGKALGNIAGRIARDERTATRETLVLAGSYPMLPSQIVERCGIPPTRVTHILTIVPPTIGEQDPHGLDLRRVLKTHGPNGWAIADVSEWDPASAHATRSSGLGDRTQRLVSYLISLSRLPVVLIATGPHTVVDLQRAAPHEHTGV